MIDAIGQIGFDPGSEWGTGLTSTADNTLRRKGTISAGDTNGSDAFDPSIEWDGFATNTFDGLGSHTLASADQPPAVTSTYPSDGTAGVPVDTNLTITFTESVNVSGAWYELNCSVSGIKSGVVSGGPTVFTINPDTNLIGGESCTLTVFAANVTDQDANDPPDNMTLNFTAGFSTVDVCTLAFTPIYDIQGSGPNAAITGSVTTQGVVVGDYEGASPTLRGFYLQDSEGDGDDSTSDGIFVFNGNNNHVNLGDVVRVAGSVSEFQGQTQISASSVVNCGTGSVTPADVTFPVPSSTYLEQYEGMLVRLPQTLYVTEHFQLGRFGQVVMSSGARLQQPTNVTTPGASALALQADNNLNRIIIDDAVNGQNPDPILFGRGGLSLSASNTLRGGDTATGIVGVMTYTWAGNSASGNAYRVRPINALGGGVPEFEPANPRPTSVPAVGGTLKVVGMNLLNYFNTFDGIPDTVDNCANGVGGTAADCRGADDQTEFDRQSDKIVNAILALDADVVGIVEIENDGYDSASAIQDLANKLNAATAPGNYAFINPDTTLGANSLGLDAIKVGLLYQPAKVAPVGTTAVLNTVAFINGGDSAARNHASLLQAFQSTSGEKFLVNVNHLKSKGSACDVADAGDGQGNCNLVRLAAVNELLTWFATDPTGTGDPDLLIVGDLNSYAKEDPIAAFETAGYTNLAAQFEGASAYSYVFDGQWGYLDYGLASPSLLAQTAGFADWHINSDEPSVLDYNTNFKTAGQITDLYSPEPFRTSDHDPVMVGLNLVPPTVVSSLRADPSPTSAASVNFTVTFSESVTGVDVTDFILTATGVTGASATSVTPVSATVYTVTVNTGAGSGTLRLDIPASASITDLVGNPLAGLPYLTGDAYTVRWYILFMPLILR